MICTTAISSIESNIANFEDEIEKEEVAAFKVNLQLAIANFAAVGTSHTPSQSLLHTQTTEGSSFGLGKDNSIVNKVAVAIPRIPKILASDGGSIQEIIKLPKNSQKIEDIWATVARNGV